jgi:hypothetical protein
MVIVDFFALILVTAVTSMIWASLQTVEGDKVKGYKKVNDDLWVETKVPGNRKPKYPNLWEPVIPPKK